MKCNEIYKYLFVYAKGIISEENKQKIEQHIGECEKCAAIASSMQKLVSTMSFPENKEFVHFLINFPDLKLTFSGTRAEIENYEKMNEELEQSNGQITNSQNYIIGGGSYGNDVTNIFDNEGNEIVFETVKGDRKHYQIRATYLKKVFPYMWLYNVFNDNNDFCKIIKSKEAPNLFYGNMGNSFGADVKSAIYQAIPSNAENICIKRGNGVIDCGSYKFAYADRYLAEEERIALDYSFILNK